MRDAAIIFDAFHFGAENNKHAIAVDEPPFGEFHEGSFIDEPLYIPDDTCRGAVHYSQYVNAFALVAFLDGGGKSQFPGGRYLDRLPLRGPPDMHMKVCKKMSHPACDGIIF